MEMKIDRELYNLSCIKNMGDEYFARWEAIKNVYAPILDEGSVYRPVAYTYHDYTHHCFNIFKIVSKNILYMPSLTAQEWFILNTAILLHDFSMTFVDFNRLMHSKQSAEWLLNKIETELVLRQNLSRDEAEVVALIIMAHSDCKEKRDNKEEISEFTLENPEIKDEMECGGAKAVRVKFLAGILRTADECDVTRNRLGTADIDKLDDNDSEQRYSKEQWLQLKCFKSLDRNRDELVLIIDDAYVKKNMDKGDEIRSRIKKVVSKIRKQITYVRQQCLVKDDYAAMFLVQNVIISSSALSKKFIEEVNNGKEEVEEYPEIHVRLLDEGLESMIVDKIDKNELKKQGHYIITQNCCERDWIELRDIVINKELSDRIIDRITNEIQKKCNTADRMILVAMEENSLILTSQIAYRMSLPFSYIIPCNYNLKKSSKQERDINFESYDKIILITDAVATFQTLGLTCEEHKIWDKVCAIYTLLYREPSDKRFFHENAAKLAAVMTTCCNKYPSEVHDRNKCRDNENGKCIALNK